MGRVMTMCAGSCVVPDEGTENKEDNALHLKTLTCPKFLLKL